MSSATDINAKEGQPANGQPPQKKVRLNPVALEVPVSVTGARPVESKDKRELFTEETITVLVFRDGAVIQLSAAVAVGQLLFLTEKRTKKEVVCQVVHKRSHRPTSCFVELEFTEPEENFWGVSFPSQEDSTQAPPVAEAVEAEETTEDDRSEPVAAPKSEDVAQLKDEVAALKAQLEELRGKQPTEDKDAVARKLAEAEAAARSAAEIEAKQKAEAAARQKAERAAAEAAAGAAAESEGKQSWEEQCKREEAESRRIAEEDALKKVEPVKAEESGTPSTVGMRLPSARLGAAMDTPVPQTRNTEAVLERKEGEKEEIDPLEELLPKPALDFSHVPKHVDPNDPFNIYRPERQGLGQREVLAGGVLLAAVIFAGVGAWYMNKLPFLRRAPKASVAADESGPSKAAGITGAPPAASGANAGSVAPSGGAKEQPTGSAAAEQVNNFSTGAASATPKSAASTPPAIAPVAPAPIESPAERVALAEKGGMRVVAPAKTGKGKPAAVKSGKNHGKAQTSGESAPVPVAPEVSVSNEPIVAAKLLRAVPPLYPPDAMRNYITGDVRIEADVDKQGHIGAMRVLLGPQQFRQVAMDALKQYEYAPATQGGKAVASKVTVTIKFWFDP